MSLVSHKKKGFTLIEIFITISVLAVVSAVSIYYYSDYVEDARMTVRITNVKLLNEALKQYYNENMSYPKYDYKSDDPNDLKNNINKGLDKALSKYFPNKKPSEILKEATEGKGYNIYYLVTRPKKKNRTLDEDPTENLDNAFYSGIWKMAKNLRIETHDYFVNEIRIDDTGLETPTFDNLEKFYFPFISNSMPLNESGNVHNTVPVDTELDIKMVCCPAGRFRMGAESDELGKRTNETAHWVTLTKSFLISKYEITQKQYMKVIGTNPSKFNSDTNRPVETVSYNEAIEFCNKLNTEYSRFVPYGYKFDLPTEAQWEYACRAGTTTSLNNGENITTAGENDYCPNADKVAWYKKSKNSNANPHFVGDPRKLPNAWGIYDMHGNVQEFVKDLRQVNGTQYPDYPPGEAVDPLVTAGNQNCYRGGSYNSPAFRCRSASRDGFAKGNKNSTVGFRVVLVSTE